jgi:hypothetical protein
MALLDDIASLIEDADIEHPAPDGQLWAHAIPAAAEDDCVGLYVYGGEPNQETFGSGPAAVEQPRVQVLVRGTISDVAYAKCRAIYELLQPITNETVNGQDYKRIQPLQVPFGMGQDAAGRFLVAFNCSVALAGTEA